MDCVEKISELKKQIKEVLSPLIDHDYIYLDLPYYTNIGDILIWKGTEGYLKTISYRCIYKSSIETYIKPKISKETIILIQGGGNFGDIWRRHVDFWLEIIKEFPDNKIIILPQTVFYQDDKIMKLDAMIMGCHSKLFICARDTTTQKLLQRSFSNMILLIPDMAFFIDEKYFKGFRRTNNSKSLLFKRNDIELQQYDFEKHIPPDELFETHDWPSMEKSLFILETINKLKGLLRITKGHIYINHFVAKIINWYAIYIFMPRLFSIGIKFIWSYNHIYTTRLHGAIASVLLQKKCTFFDNSYGKNSSFYNTWLTNINSFVFIKKEMTC